jgi:Cdc6-like AAA superfamily ATPase
MATFFSGAPFALTADRKAAQYWAGRPDILTKLQRVCSSYAARPDSSVLLTWANLGAGKTHALLHLAYLLRASNAVPTYVETPQQLRTFVDLYRRVVEEIPSEDLLDLADVDGLSSDVRCVVRVLQHGSPQDKRLIRDWLSAGRPHLRDLRAASGITSRIDTDSHAADVLSNLVAAFGARGRRLVILLDEFQRIGAMPARHREMVLSHLRSVFSRNSSHFSVVIAVGSRLERTALDLLPPELRTLMGVQPPISLPEMSSAEALDFINGRLAAFRPPGYTGLPSAPFGDRALKTLVGFIAAQDSARMIPRTILQALAILYDDLSRSEFVDEPHSSRVTECLRGLNWET